MRWNTVVGLVPVSVEQDRHGTVREKRGDVREVFANTLNVGLSTWSQAFANGLRPDARCEMWTLEYEGEPIAIIDGVEYDVVNVYDRGVKTTLTLTRRARNVERADGGQESAESGISGDETWEVGES